VAAIAALVGNLYLSRCQKAFFFDCSFVDDSAIKVKTALWTFIIALIVTKPKPPNANHAAHEGNTQPPSKIRPAQNKYGQGEEQQKVADEPDPTPTIHR